MNVKLLRQVRDHILEEPRRLFMSLYIYRDRSGRTVCLDGIKRTVPSCGTVACIGGWAALLAGVKPEDVGEFDASKALQLSKEQSERLFATHHWPTEYCDRWREATSLKARAKIAADRINYFIRTKGER